MVRPDFDFSEIDLRIWDFARLGGGGGGKGEKLKISNVFFGGVFGEKN